MTISPRADGEIQMRCDITTVHYAPIKSVWSRIFSQVLEDELNQKKREQEVFFRMSEDPEAQIVGSPTKLTKFLPYADSSST